MRYGSDPESSACLESRTAATARTRPPGTSFNVRAKRVDGRQNYAHELGPGFIQRRQRRYAVQLSRFQQFTVDAERGHVEGTCIDQRTS